MQMCLIQNQHHTMPPPLCNCHTRWKVPSDQLLVLQMSATSSKCTTTSVLAYIQIKSTLTVNRHFYSLLTTLQFSQGHNKEKTFTICTFYSCHFQDFLAHLGLTFDITLYSSVQHWPCAGVCITGCMASY